MASYDAFVLCGDGDEDFMLEMVRTLEVQGLKCCLKDRDLLGENLLLFVRYLGVFPTFSARLTVPYLSHA